MRTAPRPIPTLHTARGHAMPHVAVLDELGEPLVTALDVQSLRRGDDHLVIVTGWRVRADLDALLRVTIKLTMDGTYTLERGHVDATASVPTYHADAQVGGLAFDVLPAAVAAIVTGACHVELEAFEAHA